MKYLNVAFMALFFCASSFIFLSASTESINKRVLGIDISSQLITVKWNTGQTQKISAWVEPGFLDYNYKLVDVNFDGFEDLIIKELNDSNSSDAVFLYENQLGKFSENSFINGESLFLNEKEQFLCVISKNKESIDIVQYFYSGGKTASYDYDFLEKKGKSVIESKEVPIRKSEFDAKVSMCTKNINL